MKSQDKVTPTNQVDTPEVSESMPPSQSNKTASQPEAQPNADTINFRKLLLGRRTLFLKAKPGDSDLSDSEADFTSEDETVEEPPSPTFKKR